MRLDQFSKVFDFKQLLQTRIQKIERQVKLND